MWGNSRATMSAEPSREALSTTMISALREAASRRTEARQSRRRSRVLKEMMRMERSKGGGISVVGAGKGMRVAVIASSGARFEASYGAGRGWRWRRGPGG